MKLITTLVLALAFTSSLYAGNIFSTISGMTMDEIKPDKAYTIDTTGFNPRVYQFSTKLPDNTRVTCIALFPNADGSNTTAVATMECIKLK